MKNIDVCLSHASDHWSTPSFIYRPLMEAGFYDPCPLHADFNGLEKCFSQFTFVNPPYSDVASWVDYAISESKRIPHSLIILLVPARTDTKWFKQLFTYDRAYFQFFTGRLKFGDSKNSAPFPSMLVYLDRFYSFLDTRFHLIGNNEKNNIIDHYIYLKDLRFRLFL